MLPKYPPEVEGVTRVQTKSCRACDMEHERDKKYVRGGFYKRKYLTKKKVPFQVFYKEYYLKQLKKYTYHRVGVRHVSLWNDRLRIDHTSRYSRS
jgi:hypothetical protein